jgi:hypothetical protein
MHGGPGALTRVRLPSLRATRRLDRISSRSLVRAIPAAFAASWTPEEMRGSGIGSSFCYLGDVVWAVHDVRWG